MDALWGLGQKIPEHIGVLQIGLGVPLLSVDKVWKLTGISDKKDRSVIPNEVPVSLLCVKLDREAPGIPLGIGRAGLPAHCRKPGKNRGCLSDLAKKLCLAKLSQILSNSKHPVRPGALGMHNPLWDALSIKASNFINKMSIL